MLRRLEKFFVLQIGDKSDSVSVDRLKTVISAVPVTPAVPPLGGHPRLVPASITGPPDPGRLPVKKVRFFIPVPATKLRWNSHWKVKGSMAGRDKILKLEAERLREMAEKTGTAEAEDGTKLKGQERASATTFSELGM